MTLILLLREWRTPVVVGIVCLGVGILLGRLTASGSRPHDVSFDTETYHTCMYLYRDVAGCAEVMKRLAGNRADAN
jgi:hypothetical protein